MALSDGMKQYFQALTDTPELVIFDYLAAQRVWQKYFSDLGGVKFHGKDSYIAFMQALMINGVKGTALIKHLGELYQAGSSPGASAKSVIKTAGKTAYTGIMEYEKQIKDLERAELGWAWKNGAKYDCGFVFEMMKNNMDISPGDLGG